LFGICFRGGFSVAPGGVCGETTFYRLYKATDTRLDSIAWGALIAVLASGKARLHLENILAIRFVQLTAVGLLLIGFLVRNLEFREVFRYSLQGLALSVLLPVICGSKNHLRVILETTPFLYIGRLSYSLYLWHWGAVTLSDWLEPKNGIIWFTVAAGTTIAGACFSYYAIERPMMTFRRRAGSHLAGKSPIVVSP
jgi:peptidoglycan/LPS O-acetylase OafA/YrhL